MRPIFQVRIQEERGGGVPGPAHPPILAQIKIFFKCKKLVPLEGAGQIWTMGRPPPPPFDNSWIRPCIPPARMGLCVRSVVFCVGSARLFRSQHVGIGNAKVLCWGDYPTQGPNARGFALRWNIGFRSTFADIMVDRCLMKPQRIITVRWVKLFRIYYKGPVRAIGKVLLMKLP